MGTYGAADVGFILVDGFDLLPYTYELTDDEAEMLLEEITVFGQAWVAMGFVGIRQMKFQVNGFYDDALGGSDVALVGPPTTSRLICWTPETNVLGHHFMGYSGSYETKYTRQPVRKQFTKFQAPFTGSGQLWRGRLLAPQQTVSGATGNGTAYLNQDIPAAINLASTAAASPKVFGTSGAVPHNLLLNDSVIIAGVTQNGSAVNPNAAWQVIATGLTASNFELKGPASAPVTVADSGTGWTGGTVQQTSSRNGGAAFLQMPALTLGGYTSLTVKVQHSIDSITWVDLATFTTVTASPNAQVVLVAPGTTVFGYLRYTYTFVGAGAAQSANLMVGFARG